MTTSQPASAKLAAQARPSPLLEAQTMALRPAMPRSMAFSQGCVDSTAGGAAFSRSSLAGQGAVVNLAASVAVSQAVRLSVATPSSARPAKRKRPS